MPSILIAQCRVNNLFFPLRLTRVGIDAAVDQRAASSGLAKRGEILRFYA